LRLPEPSYVISQYWPLRDPLTGVWYRIRF
jgi:hypothetical protein